MWWNRKLERTRREIEQIKLALTQPPPPERHRDSRGGGGFSVAEIGAFGFALISIVGPGRAVRMAATAVSAVKTARMLVSALRSDAQPPEPPPSPPEVRVRHSRTVSPRRSARARAASRHDRG